MTSVLVTGASRGIGMATSLVLGRAGLKVFATMRNPEASPELARTAAEEGLPIEVFAMDVNSDASVAEVFRVIEEDDSSVDVLVNNAGIEARGSVEELDLTVFRAVMETNYFGALRCIKAVLPQMRVRREGCIVNVTSVAGRISSSPLGAYAASKFALEGLSEALAQEAKMFNIRVAIVQPGIIDTAMARRIGAGPIGSVYPHQHRFAGLFAASLQKPASPFLVAEKIRDVIGSGSWTLRHPVGPDAGPFLEWRSGMTDEEFIDWGASDNDTWYENVEREFGLDARLPE